jgi:Bacterial aa3 type cytochrome c oxidase subunit IV
MAERRAFPVRICGRPSMSEYRHGEMDIRQNERTFEGFVKAVIYVIIAVIVALLFMAAVNS